ncbi:MAG: hypothetical protein HY094_00495 [Candidatus Melainabacteria bacterium]|nr:hypothetical protein [Candidatus Melainabacteria bacterium]
MILERQKYSAYTFNVAGFALMTPVGRLFLQPLEIFKEYGLIMFMSYGIICLGLFLCGVFFILKGFEILDL